jgi:hypothetical protein
MDIKKSDLEMVLKGETGTPLNPPEILKQLLEAARRNDAFVVDDATGQRRRLTVEELTPDGS